jgi:hypothetical protein
LGVESHNPGKKIDLFQTIVRQHRIDFGCLAAHVIEGCGTKLPLAPKLFREKSRDLHVAYEINVHGD